MIYGPEDAKLVILGHMPTPEDAANGYPFSSGLGRNLSALLTQANISRNHIGVGYIYPRPTRFGDWKSLFLDKACTLPGPELQEAIDRLEIQLQEMKVNCIVCLGGDAMHLLTGQSKIETFRGYTLQSTIFKKPIKVIPSYDLKRLYAERHQNYTMTIDLKKGYNNSLHPALAYPEKQLITSASPGEFIDYADWLIAVKKKGIYQSNLIGKFPCAEEVETGIALDIENTLGNGCHITQFGIGHSLNFAMTINFVKGKTACLNEADETRVWMKIAELAKSDLTWIAHNGVHDSSVLWLNNHILFKIDFDTMLAAQLLWPELKKSLGFLSSICLDVPPWKHVSGEDTYNPEDVSNTKGIASVLKKQLKTRGLGKIFSLEMQEVPIASMMQLQGIKVNRVTMNKLHQEYTTLCQDIKKCLDLEVARYTSDKVNYASPKQLKKLLYEDLGLPRQFKRRKSIKDDRKETTDDEALVKLCNKTKSPIPQLLRKYKKTIKALNTYLEFPVSPQSRVHTSYNIGSAVERFVVKLGQEDSRSLGRWSSSGSIILPYGPGNLQSVPRYARKMFEPIENGHEIGSGDYIQAEAEVVANLSHDEVLLRAIKRAKALRHALLFEDSPAKREIIQKKLNEVDMHKMKANELFGIPIQEVTKEQRQVGKVIRHESNYNGGPKVAQVQAAKLGIYEELAYWKKLLAINEQKSPALSRWHKNIVDELGSSGRILINCFGRARKFLGEFNEDLFKKAYAFKPQSTIGDLLNTATLKFYNRYGADPKMRILLNLHDGLYISYPKEERVKWLQRLRRCMLIEMKVGGNLVTIDADFSAGPNWGEMEEVNVPYEDFEF